MQASQRNLQRMAEVVSDANAQALHHLVAFSKWSWGAVTGDVSLLADQMIGGSPDTGLLLDESACGKKGKHSVGVARQWSGRQGKIDNCQVGVFAALVRGVWGTLISVRLYLPEVWTQDVDRCRAAGVPEDQIRFRSKSELALELVREARERGVRFAWVGADAGYGKEPAFLRSLDQLGEVFVIDVHRDQRIYLDDPCPAPAPRRSARGRAPSRLQAQIPAERVDAWASAQPRTAWRRRLVRHGTKGDIRVEFLHRRVWLWDGREPQAHLWHLVVVRELRSPGKIHYALSNAPASTPERRLVSLQRQRFWVEQSLKEAKKEAGLGEYQVRRWLPWHRHMALVMMAMLFLLGERLEQRDPYPLLSCADVKSLLAHYLPRRDCTPEEVLRQLEARHRQRWSSIQSAYRRQGRKPPTLEQWRAVRQRAGT